jgi:6-phosphogluconolactonase
MARETLLAHVPVPPGNVHRIRGEEEPGAAAREYEDELRAFFGAAPRLDLVLLGMGADGHTASLFPGSPGLEDRSRWVVATVPPAPGARRITLTLRALRGVSRVVFLVEGPSKAPALARVLAGGPDAAALPAARVRPSSGTVLWLVDRPAALLLVPGTRD